MEEFVYRIDVAGVIRSVSPNWDRFARQNNGDTACAANVLGRPLNDFICDVETRHLYRSIIDRSKRSSSAVTIPFRCDAPETIRDMEMTILPASDGGIEFVSRVVNETPRRVARLLDASVERTTEILVACGWCKKVRLPQRWVDVEEAVRTQGYSSRRPCREYRTEYARNARTSSDVSWLGSMNEGAAA